MAELGIVYTLESPYGRAVFGGPGAELDADYIGRLDGENGITGLFDLPASRLGGGDLPGGDGGFDTAGLLGRRSGTIQGRIEIGSGMADSNAREDKLKAAADITAVDGVLSWTPSGADAPRMMRVRRQTGPAITGRRPKQWQLGLISRDAYILDLDETGANPNEWALREWWEMWPGSWVKYGSEITAVGNVSLWPTFRIADATDLVTIHTIVGGDTDVVVQHDVGIVPVDVVVIPELRLFTVNGTPVVPYYAVWSLAECQPATPTAFALQVDGAPIPGEPSGTFYRRRWR